MSVVRYRCPACGFQIFNRRVPKCESCGVKLPPELLFSAEQIDALDAEHEKSRREREARARDRMRSGRLGSGDSGGGGSDSSWDGGDGGDGGGSD